MCLESPLFNWKSLGVHPCNIHKKDPSGYWLSKEDLFFYTKKALFLLQTRYKPAACYLPSCFTTLFCYTLHQTIKRPNMGKNKRCERRCCSLQNWQKGDVEGLCNRFIKSDMLHDVFLSTLYWRVVVQWGKSGMRSSKAGFLSALRKCSATSAIQRYCTLFSCTCTWFSAA